MYHYGPLVKWPKTPASHAGNTSSNLVRVTIDLNESKKRSGLKVQIVGVFSDEGPPVPIPNTVVKLISADNTWLEAAREDKAMPTQLRTTAKAVVFNFSQTFLKFFRKSIDKQILYVYNIAC